jgi:hypothetical protein
VDAEDIRLLVAVARFGARDWRRISEFVGGGRTSSQCNQRWGRVLDPSIVHEHWTPAEDSNLLKLVEIMGNSSWCQIAKLMIGRTDLQCRHRYQQLGKPLDVEKSEDVETDEMSEITKKQSGRFIEPLFKPGDDPNQGYCQRLQPPVFRGFE